MLDALMQWINNLITNFGKAVLQVLPVSPFRGFIDSFAVPEYVGWLNWFFPVSQCLQILTVWLAAIALFYLYSIIMRWIKMIGD